MNSLHYLQKDLLNRLRKLTANQNGPLTKIIGHPSLNETDPQETISKLKPDMPVGLLKVERLEYPPRIEPCTQVDYNCFFSLDCLEEGAGKTPEQKQNFMFHCIDAYNESVNDFPVDAVNFAPYYQFIEYATQRAQIVDGNGIFGVTFSFYVRVLGVAQWQT